MPVLPKPCRGVKRCAHVVVGAAGLGGGVLGVQREAGRQPAAAALFAGAWHEGMRVRAWRRGALSSASPNIPSFWFRVYAKALEGVRGMHGMRTW